MYEFLTKKKQDINGVPYYLILVECYDEHCDNYSIAKVYVKITDEIEDKLSYISKHDDITSMIGFKVRNDGHVVLTLK